MSDDLERKPINMGQAMDVMVVALQATINTFLRDDHDEKTKRDVSWIALSVFLHNLLLSSKHKDIAIKVLEALIEELRNAQSSQAPVE